MPGFPNSIGNGNEVINRIKKVKYLWIIINDQSNRGTHINELNKTLIPPLPFTKGCGLHAAFERPNNCPGRSVVPKPRKFCFCVTAAARPLRVPWAIKTAVVSQQVCRGGIVSAESLPWWVKGCRGHPMEAQWSPQWSLIGCYRSVKGGTMVVQGRQRHRSK